MMSEKNNEIPPPAISSIAYLSVPTHSRLHPQLHGQGLGHLRGSTAKHRPDECSSSQLLRHDPDRPRKKRLDVTEAPADAVYVISSDEEDTKSNVKSSRILKHDPKENYTAQQTPDEESKKVIIQLKSLLIKKLLTSANDVDGMVQHANATFGYLKMLGVDYGSFYIDVEQYIKHHCNLQDAQRGKTLQSLLAIQNDYENATSTTYYAWEDYGHSLEELDKVKEKKETLKRQIVDLNHEEEHLKHDLTKYKEVHEVSKAKMEELGAQLEPKLSEIEQRKNVALQGIDSITRRLQSRFRGDLN